MSNFHCQEQCTTWPAVFSKRRKRVRALLRALDQSCRTRYLHGDSVLLRDLLALNAKLQPYPRITVTAEQRSGTV
jgi:hypothetical protein